MKITLRKQAGQRAKLALGLALLLSPSPILIVPIAAASPPKQSDHVRLLGSTASEVRFLADFEPPVWRESDAGGERLRYPSWPSLMLLARPGEPEIGTRVVRVALPPEGDVLLEEIPEGGESLGEIRVPVAADPGPREPFAAGNPVAVLPPATHATLLALGMERGLRVATIVVRPTRRGSSTQTLWSPRVEVRLQVTGEQASRTRRPVRDAVWTPLRRESLLNPDSVEEFLAPAQPPAALPDAWFDDAQGWIKIQITANGVYTLTRDALAAAGAPASTLDPRTLRLFSGPLVPDLAWTTLGWDTLVTGVDTTVVSGWEHVYDRPGFGTGFGEAGGFEEIAIWVDGEADGDLDAADRVVFHALGPDNFRDRFRLPSAAEDYFENPYTDRTVYWLGWGGSLPGAPKRMAMVSVTPPGGAVPDTSALARVHAERNSLYFPSFYKPGLRWESFFWDFLNNQSSGKRFPVTLPSAVTGTTLSAQIRVWGGNVPGENPPESLHHLQVDVNATSAGIFQWGGSTVYAALTPLDVQVSGIPVASPSNFDFRVPTLVTGRLDQSFLAWIDVTYPRRLALGSQPGELPVDAGSPGRTVRITQVPSGTLDVFDVTDFRAVRRLTGFTQNVTASGPGVELTLDGSNAGFVAVASRSAPRSPAALILDDPPDAYGGASWLRDPSAALDHMIVAHDGFLAEAQSLADHRQTSLYGVTPGRAGRSRAVRVSDVMDEFAWGMWDPTALRYFLEYAYLYYGGVGADRLAYAVFLGDHTFDFRNYLSSGMPDFVPSWEDNREDLITINLGSVQYASDDPLVRFDGAADPYEDVAVGRIPVSTLADARAVIQDKIVGPEADPDYGSWRSRVLLAADDLCAGGNPDPVGDDFLIHIERSDANLPAAYDRSKIYLTEYGTSCTIVTKPDATTDWKAAWNEGAWLVNYIGHGDEANYAGERFLTLAGVADLTNLSRLPLFIATASRSAKYNLPAQNSITEAIAVSPTGGALAATGSVSNQTFANAALALNDAFVLGLFEIDPGCSCPVRVRAAGLAFTQAKQSIPAEAAKYVFLGDPASVPPAPRLDALTLAGPDSLARGGLAQVRARLTDAALANPLMEIRAEDATRTPNFVPGGYRLPGDLMFRGDAAFVADSTNAAFVVPLSAREGPDARIRGYVHGDGWDAAAALTPVTLQGQVDPSTDTVGPIITFNSHPSQVVVGDVLSALLEDPSGIRVFVDGGSALELVVRDEASTEVARLPVTEGFAYEVGSYTRGAVSFPVPDLENGAYTFTVTAADNFGNAASSSTTAQVTPTGSGVRFLDVYAYPNPLETETDVVFTLERPVDVTLRLYSVSGRLVRKATLAAAAGRNGWRWDGRDETGDEVANGVYLLQLSAESGSDEDDVKHLERLVVVR